MAVHTSITSPDLPSTVNNNHPSREASPCKLVKIEPKSYTSHVPRNLFSKQYVTLLLRCLKLKPFTFYTIIIIPNSVLIYENFVFLTSSTRICSIYFLILGWMQNCKGQEVEDFNSHLTAALWNQRVPQMDV